MRERECREEGEGEKVKVSEERGAGMGRWGGGQWRDTHQEVIEVRGRDDVTEARTFDLTPCDIVWFGELG